MTSIRKWTEKIASHRRTLLIGMGITLIWSAVSVGFVQLNRIRGLEYLQDERSGFASELASIQWSYEDFSSYIFQKSLDLPQVSTLMEQALEAEPQEKDRLRARLYRLLEDDYRHQKVHQFEGMQFHFPDGETFLRFAMPERYGDNVLLSRAVIRSANRYVRYARGFEVARSMSGYRFVYPLFSGTTHVGSVELVVSPEVVTGILQEMYPERRFHLVVRKGLVENQAFPETRDRYVELEGSGSFLWYAPENGSRPAEEDMKYLSLALKKGDENLGSRESFTTVLEGEEGTLLADFLPVTDSSMQLVGYFTSLRPAGYYLGILDMRRELIFSLLTWLMTMGAFLVLEMDRRRIRRLAFRDQLTGLYNRHYFLQRADSEWERAGRSGEEFSILMFDIDHFKKVNDTFGHQSGDQVLKKLSGLVQGTVRGQDTVARWGGEEFIVLLPDTPAEGALVLGERIRSAVEDEEFQVVGKVTISVGLAAWSARDSSLDRLIARADSALYQAKENGRNQVRTDPGPEGTGTVA